MKKAVIEINNLCKNYGSAMGVKNINLTVYEGEIFGFIGPNGAGKSTTIRTILNFLYPTSGSIKIFGLDSVKDSTKIKKEIGYVPSEVNYYDFMKVKDLLLFNKSFYPNITTKKIDDLCKILELDQDKKISKLSLGNKKKVAVVQALMGNHKLLILDEPTNGLDPLIQNKLFELLKKYQRSGTTIFLSSHNLAEVEKYCDRVGIVKDGKILDIKEVAKINRLDMKKVVIKSDEDINLNIKGIEDLHRINGEIHFIFNNGIDQLIKALSKYKIKDITILPISLEDDFLKYYERGN